jgi:EmrB/QacA subfamily drug resistance transporter
MICSFLTALDVMVVGTAMPTIIGSLGGLSLYSWVFAIYLLTGTISMPIFGKLADLFGRKPVFVAGAGIFIVGSMLCGLAQSMEQLILFRAVQGLGSGAVLPITLTIIGDVFALEERARVTGALSIVWGVASILGPPVGGFITDFWSWRWIFYINLPIGLLAIATLSWTLREQVERRSHRIDYAGAALLAVALSGLLLALMEAGQPGSALGSMALAGLFVGSLVLLGTFVWQEQRAEEPIVPLHLFRNKLFLAACLGGCMNGAVIIATNSFVPPFVRGVLGESTAVAGLPLVAGSTGWSLGSFITGRAVLEAGYRRCGLFGSLLLVGGMVGLTLLSTSAQLWQVLLTMGVLGGGMGACSAIFLISVQSAVPWSQRGAATSTTWLFRSIGGSLGVTLCGSVFNARLSGALNALPGAAGIDSNVVLDPSARAALADSLLPGLVQGLQQALQASYFVALGMALIVLAAVLLLPGGRAEKHAWREPANVDAGPAPSSA